MPGACIGGGRAVRSRTGSVLWDRPGLEVGELEPPVARAGADDEAGAHTAFVEMAAGLGRGLAGEIQLLVPDAFDRGVGVDAGLPRVRFAGEFAGFVRAVEEDEGQGD